MKVTGRCYAKPVADTLPRIWILSRGRKGDLDQMLVLARAVGWPFEVKELRFAGPEFPVLSRLLLRNSAKALTPPWPDLVLCAEASPSVIARYVKEVSGGKTRAVCIGRPAGSAAGFDLVITTAQYRLPPASNVVEIAMPIAAEAAPAAVPSPPDGPIAVIVGGPAFPDRLDHAAALALAADMLAYAKTRNSVLAVHTSPRTSKDVISALASTITAPHRLHLFGQGENRYREILSKASEIVVTSDSVSMVSDGLNAGKPVSIYPLPQRNSVKLRLGEWLYRNSVETPALGTAPIRWLFDSGLIEVAADRRKLFARLVAESRLGWFGEPQVPPQPKAASKDLARAVDALRAVMARGDCL